jgi:hypothetical protein
MNPVMSDFLASIRLARAAAALGAAGALASCAPLGSGAPNAQSCADSALVGVWRRADNQETLTFSTSCEFTSTVCRSRAYYSSDATGAARLYDMSVGDSSCQQRQPDRSCTYRIEGSGLSLGCSPTGGGSYQRVS